MATAYSYGRVSHVNQKDGDSVPAQSQRTQGYFDHKSSDTEHNLHGVAWGGFFHDGKNISAYKKPFSKRPAGRDLMALLQPGDHIIFDKVDRIWRSNEDFVDLMRWFKRHKITVHFVSLSGCSIDMGTPMGDFLLGLFVNLAELEAARVAERTRDGKTYRRLNSLFQGGRHTLPIGCKLTGLVDRRTGRQRNTLRLEWDWQERAIMAKIVEWKDAGRDARWITAQCQKMRCDQRGEEFKPLALDNYWNEPKVHQAMLRERALQWRGGNPDPNSLIFGQLDKQYREWYWSEHNIVPEHRRGRKIGWRKERDALDA